MRSDLHERHVDDIIATIPGARRARFMAALKSEVSRHEDASLGEVDADAGLCIPRILPDAYVVDLERRLVVAYEVEITHRITPRKATLYLDLARLLDEMAYSLLIVTVDRYGVWRQWPEAATAEAA